MIFESFSVILRQISLGVQSHAVVHFHCLTKKSRFWVFSEILRQISLGVHSHAVVHFPCLTKNPSKIEILGLCRNARLNITRNTFVRRRSFSLSYEKILQKSKLWDFSVILRQISLGIHSYTVVHFPCLTKKSFKNRDFWVFAVTLGQISLGVHSHAVVHFPCLTKKSFKNRDFGSLP